MYCMHSYAQDSSVCPCLYLLVHHCEVPSGMVAMVLVHGSPRVEPDSLSLPALPVILFLADFKLDCFSSRRFLHVHLFSYVRRRIHQSCRHDPCPHLPLPLPLPLPPCPLTGPSPPLPLPPPGPMSKLKLMHSTPIHQISPHSTKMNCRCNRRSNE